MQRRVVLSAVVVGILAAPLAAEAQQAARIVRVGYLGAGEHLLIFPE